MAAVPRDLLDWGELSPLALEARELCEGLYSGAHRSRRRGSGIEFDGHRDYVPGDDLRRLDSRALLRHGRLLVRQFEMETERNLCLLLDASRSMAYRSSAAPAAKLAYASLLAAALGRLSIASGDTLSLDWLGGDKAKALPSNGGREAFERLLVALEFGAPGGDERLAEGGLATAVGAVARRARRGAIIVMLSDLLDLPEGSVREVTALAGRDRRLLVIQVLDPVEQTFPFVGPVRLRGSTGSAVVETDADRAREGYLAALSALQQTWATELSRHGGRLLVANTKEPPIDVLRKALAILEGERA